MTRQARPDHMASWTFFGRILPERIPIRMELPAATTEQTDFGLTYETHVGIADGQFVADVTVTKGAVDIHTLRNLIERHIRTTTDLIGYQNGFGYDVEVIAAVCRETGERCIFGPAIPVLSQRRGNAFATSIEGALYLAVLKEVSAQIVLANFREAIRIPVDSGFFCYRAIDAMMQSVRLNPSEKARAWERLRLALSVDKAAIDLVKR